MTGSRTVAILLAGGSATRLGSNENKVYLELAGRPMLAWSLDAFERSPLVDDVVLVVRDTDRERATAIAAAVPARKVSLIVDGGDTRHESERAGLEAIADEIASGRVGLVAIHDGARPFIRQALLERILGAAAEVGGAVPAMPVDSEFLLRVDPSGASELVDAATLKGMQTPQAFRAAELLAAYRAAEVADFHGVDTAESVERFSDLVVATVDGDADNMKVTFVEDLILAEKRAATWGEAPGGPAAG